MARTKQTVRMKRAATDAIVDRESKKQERQKKKRKTEHKEQEEKDKKEAKEEDDEAEEEDFEQCEASVRQLLEDAGVGLSETKKQELLQRVYTMTYKMCLDSGIHPAMLEW